MFHTILYPLNNKSRRKEEKRRRGGHTRVRMYLLFVMSVFQSNYYSCWSPASWEVAWKVENKIFCFPPLLHNFAFDLLNCLYFDSQVFLSILRSGRIEQLGENHVSSQAQSTTTFILLQHQLPHCTGCHWWEPLFCWESEGTRQGAQTTWTLDSKQDSSLIQVQRTLFSGFGSISSTTSEHPLDVI